MSEIDILCDIMTDHRLCHVQRKALEKVIEEKQQREQISWLVPELIQSMEWLIEYARYGYSAEEMKHDIELLEKLRRLSHE